MIEKIEQILKSDFERELLESAIKNLEDYSNKLRFNNFAYSIRELSRHILYGLSPEENVRSCVWFKPVPETDRPTRTQRIKYAIQGGISDEILSDFGFNVEELKGEIRGLKQTIDSLSKFTHINPETFGLSEEEVKTRSDQVLAHFTRFVQRIEEYRDELKKFLDGIIEDQMIQTVVSSYCESVDVLAPRFTINYHLIDDYHIIDINENNIVVEVQGSIQITLEYGSRKERREGDGLDMEESFPFVAKIEYEINNKFPQDGYNVELFEVDTSGWYE